MLLCSHRCLVEIHAMNYVFYFDETFHDKRITIKPDGTINSLLEDKNNCYIGVFWGCKQEMLHEVINSLTTFEKEYKTIFTLSDAQEFKSTTFSQKNFKHGISSFSQLTLNYYEDLFRLLLQVNPIIQINIVSKIEWMLRSVFIHAKLPPYINSNAFFYSLTKFFIVYQPKEVIAQMSSVCDIESAEQFRLHLIKTIDKVVEATLHIQRKQEEIKALSNLSIILEDTVFETAFESKIDFIYLPNFDGLCKLLDEKKINYKKAKIVIDREEKTYKAAQQFQFGKVKQADSKNSIQIRLADQICGFVGKMVKALADDLSLREEHITDINLIDQEALVDKRLLGQKWFDLDERRFSLYQLIYQVLVENCEAYWATMTMSYSDQATSFYSLLRYINSYENYAQFKAVEPSDHTEYFNSCCLKEMSRAYAEL